jgi:hypothetical protein
MFELCEFLCSDIVKVCWPASPGNPIEADAVLEEIGLAGAVIQTEFPIPRGTAIRILTHSCEFHGSVEECRFEQIGYFLAVRFAPGSHWSVSDYLPEHLFDVRAVLPQRTPQTAA